MWEIHTFGNGDVIASVLAGIRLLMMTGPYTGLLLFAILLLSALAIGNFMIDRRQYFPLFFGAVVVFYISTQIPVDVLVVDEVNSDVADQAVAGVPLAVALPAYASGYAGWRFTQLVETAFAIPANYSTGRSTLNRPMFDLQKIVGAEIRDGDLEERIGSYLMDCVFADMELTPPLAGSPTITVLRTSGDLLTDIATANLARAVGMTGIPCATYYTGELVPRFAIGSPGYDKSNRYLQTELQVMPLSILDEVGIADALLGNLIPAGQTGRQLINNAMIIKAWRQAMIQEKSKYKDTTASVAELQKTLTINLKQQAFSTSNLVQKMVPMLRTIIEGIVYLSTPVVLVLAMSPAMGAVLGLYIKMFLWLQTWGPLYAILNLVFYQEARARLTSITAAGGFGSVNLSSYDSYLEFVSMMNSVSGDYIWMVPTVGWALVWGGSSIGSALSGAGRSAQDTSSHVAGEFAAGRGQTMLEGQGPRWEQKTQLSNGTFADGVIGHASGSHMTMAPVSGSSGISMVDQAGTMTMRGQDGSVTSLAANGAMTVQNPYGSYSKDRDGKLTSGVFRGKVFDPESGRSMFMQQEVRGDEIYSRGVYRDGSGMEHQVEQVQNQSSGEQVSRLDSFQSAGLKGELKTQSDGTSELSLKRTGSSSVSHPGGKTTSGMFQMEDTYIQQPGVSGGFVHVAGTAQRIDREGEEKLSIARPGGGGELQDVLSRPGVAHAVSGTESNVVQGKKTQDGLLFTPAAGPGGSVGSVEGTIPLLVKDQEGHEYLLPKAVVSGQNLAFDSHGQPQNGFTASAAMETGKDRIQASGTVTKDPQSGQYTMKASNMTFSRKLGGESSGEQMVVPVSGNNYLELNKGEVKHFGNPHDSGTPWSYSGEVIDFQTGEKSQRTMRFDGQDVYASTGEAGSTLTKVAGDGSKMVIDGDMHSSAGAKYTRSWPSRTGLVQVGTDSGGRPVVEPRTFSQKETGVVKFSPDKGIEYSGKNDELTEHSSRGASQLSGNVVLMDKGSLVGRDGHSLVPAPSGDAAGHVLMSAEQVPVFVSSSGDESTQVRQRGIGQGLQGEPVVRNVTQVPASGAEARVQIEGGQSSNFYQDQVQIHADDQMKSSYGHWFLEAARASKNLDSHAMADKYGEWAGSLANLMKLEGFDPDNKEHQGRLLMGLEMTDKVRNVGEKTLLYGSRFGSILKSMDMAKRSKQAQQATGNIRP